LEADKRKQNKCSGVSLIESLNHIIDDARRAATWLAYRRVAGQIRDAFKSGNVKLRAGLKTAFVSSFTMDPLVDFTIVEAAASSVGLSTYIAPYGQFSQEILNPNSGLYAFAPQVTLCMIEADALSRNPVEAADQLIALVARWKERGTGVFVMCTFIADPAWPLHILQAPQEVNLKNANQRLKEHFTDDSKVQICDLDALAAYFGYSGALSPEMMAMARNPFSEEFMAVLAKKIVSYLNVQAGIIRKCLVLDCDNTLWGGIIGEDGIDGIHVGPDWPGREYLEFQKAILELYEQGVILAINSKNNPADVMQVLNEHPCMLLREKHFASIQANWDPKPKNMDAIAKEINIGLDSLVFIDDNPAERQLVRQMIPQVETLEMPANPALFARTLRQTNFFASSFLTEEDKKRGQIYADQRRRDQLQQSCTTLEDFLKSLDMKASIHLAGKEDIKRVTQLTQRTNQFNLTSRRYTEADMAVIMQNPNWRIYVLGLKDKFGDNGTVGLAIVEIMPDCWRVDTFLMSCRVIGRQAEDAFVNRICSDAAGQGVSRVKAEYIKTAKNQIAEAFWSRMGFERMSENENGTVWQKNLKQYMPQKFDYLLLSE
jgi:FkbH-like protein